MNAERLETALQELATAIEYPPTPALAAAVRQRIESGEAREPIRLFPRPRWQRVAVAVAALVIAFGATLTLSPSARQAVADLLGVAGIHIQLDDEFEPPQHIEPGLRSSEFGERISLAGAEEFVDFDIHVPAAIDAAPKIYLDRSVPGGMVSLLYLDAEPSKVLVTQFRADLDEGFFKKVDVRGGDIAYPEVNGTHGYWIAGDPHLFYYVADGRFLEETIRLVGHVLLWEEGDITYRIEGSDSLARALEIAASLR